VPSFENFNQLTSISISISSSNSSSSVTNIGKWLSTTDFCDVQGSVKVQDSGIYENKIGVELIKKAASEVELNSIYLTQLLHDVDHSLVLTLIVVRTSYYICIIHFISVSVRTSANKNGGMLYPSWTEI